MTMLLSLAALAAALPAASAPPPATLRVATADLDLASAQGRTRLDRRLHRAARAVCGEPYGFDLAGQNAARRCRVATVQIAQSAATARGMVPVQVAMTRR